MFKEFYEGASLMELPILAMILFIATFVAAVIRTWRPDDGRASHLSSLPFDDDTEVHHDA